MDKPFEIPIEMQINVNILAQTQINGKTKEVKDNMVTQNHTCKPKSIT